jgi:transposase
MPSAAPVASAVELARWLPASQGKTRPDLDIFSNNEAERTIRPVKVQQRSSGGAWRTLTGLAGFAIVQSYLSTAAKWGISTLDALRDLFNGRAWLPPGIEPSG